MQAIPIHIFLDTSVVNFILDYKEQIHDGVDVPREATRWIQRDIEALRGIWLAGQRGGWRLSISPTTIEEIRRTRDKARVHELLNWASEIWHYSEGCGMAADDKTHKSTLSQTPLSALPDSSDRQLIQEAAAFGCDAFCTRDWNTILRHRKSLGILPLSLLSPHEWWEQIHPHVALWA